MRKLMYMTAVVMAVSGAGNLMAIEEPKHSVIEKEGNLELRFYEPYLVAEVIIDDSFDEASTRAFRILFRYIDGGNSTQDKIAMTAPVSQQAAGEKIAMTAPVSQQATQGGWVISFAMPSKFTMETIPVPDDSRVKIRQIEEQKMAAVRFTGFWNQNNYNDNRSKLESWVKEKGMVVKGEPIVARYNAPFTPWFMRRNEILIPVE